MELIKAVGKALNLTNVRAFRLSSEYCPICESIKPSIKLDNNEISVRCLGCKASVVTLSLVAVLKDEMSALNTANVYELSSRGPLVKYLEMKAGSLTTSEFFPDLVSGQRVNGVLCQNVEKLSFENEVFDLCTSTDVFEHVENDLDGYSECYRVLRKGGRLIFTVPLHAERPTRERAERSSDGEIIHLYPPEYHGDPITRSGKILAWRNYGVDIVDKLKQAGFSKAEIIQPGLKGYWGISRQVVYAEK